MRLGTYPRSTAANAKEPVRKHPRALFSVPLKLHHLMAGGVRTARGLSLDISEGGIGALVQGDLSVGETVMIDLPLPERMLSAAAVVRHSSSVRSGFEFVGLTPEERLQIAAVFETYDKKTRSPAVDPR